MIKDYHITTHQVSQLSADEIKKGFIVRQNLLNRIIYKINNTNRVDSIQHFVFVGPRGSGKSSILNRIKVEYLESKSFIPIYLPEEQPGLYRLFDIWLAVIDELIASGHDIQRPEIDASQDEFSYLSKTGYTVISEFLQKENKQIILLMDNIDRVFKNIDSDKALLRELLQNHKDLIIIGGSTEMSEDFWDYGDPFYQFFKITRLEDQTKAEVNELLVHWSEVNDLPEIKDVLRTNPGKVEAIRQMTGGNPRTMIMFIRLLVDNRHAQGFEYLQNIIDQTTAIYQERLQQLTPQQRKIVVELASIWQPATVDQLVNTCLMSSSLISAQLNKLQKSRIVEALKPKKGKTVYRLKERMFNLYLIMTQAGALQKKRARYLTDFLEVWYDGREIQNYFFSTVVNFHNVNGSKSLVRAKALAHSKYISTDQRDELLNLVMEAPGLYGMDTSMLPEKSQKLFDDAASCFKKSDFKGMIEKLDLIEQPSSEKEHYLGFSYDILNDHKKAEKHYLSAINLGDRHAYNLLLNMYYYQNEKVKAAKLIPKYSNPEYPDNHTNIANLWLGNFENYTQDRNQILTEKNFYTFGHIYLTESLVHYQYDWIKEVFENNERLMISYVPIYYAGRKLMDDKLELDIILSETEMESVNDIIKYIKERQEFYYGKNENIEK